MNAALLNRAFQYVDDRYLDMVEREMAQKETPREMAQKETPQEMAQKETLREMAQEMTPQVPAAGGRYGWGYWSVAAACICLILILSLPVAAIAANWFGLRDLLLPKWAGEKTGGAFNRNYIGLSGYQDSPEAQALAEWLAYRNSYDTSGIGEGEALGSQYSVYDREMERRLRQIARKYNLKLHTAMDVINQRETAYRVGGEFMGKGLERTWAYIYEDGTFHCDGDAVLKDGRVLAFQFDRSVKGTLHEEFLNIGNVDDYEEFSYEAACGELVRLAVAPHKSLIYADFEECFILVNILEGSDFGISGEVLKELADAIDFTVLKNVRTPEMRGDSDPNRD